MMPTFVIKLSLIAVCRWVSPQYTTTCFANISTQEACMITQKLDLDQMWKEQTHTLKTVKDTEVTDSVKLTFCCKIWVYSLDMTMSEWFWWYLWHRKAIKMPHEFLTTSLDITNSKSALISNICSGVRRWDFIYQSCRKTVFVCSLSRRFLKELICVLGIICQSVLVAWLLNEFPSNVQ